MTEPILMWLGGVMGTAVFVIAEGSGGSMEDVVMNNWILKGGVAGILLLVVWCLLTGKLVPGYMHKSLLEKLKEVEARNEGMVMAGGAVPCNEDLVEHLKTELAEQRQQMIEFMREMVTQNQENFRLSKMVEDYEAKAKVRAEVARVKLAKDATGNASGSSAS